MKMKVQSDALFPDGIRLSSSVFLFALIGPLGYRAFWRVCHQYDS